MNKIKYEKRMKELDQIAEEQQLSPARAAACTAWPEMPTACPLKCA